MFTTEESQFLNNILGNITVTALHPDAANTVTMVNSIARKLAKIQEAMNKAIAEAKAKAELASRAVCDSATVETKEDDANSLPV